eukprot:3780598-Amphidinium_carterae.1
MFSFTPVGKQLSEFWALALDKNMTTFQVVIPRVMRGPQAKELASRIYGRPQSRGKHSRARHLESGAGVASCMPALFSIQPGLSD